MSLFWWKEKRLKTVWRIDKEGRTCLLVGTAHFSPYPFKKALTKLVQGAERVLFEGPLDPESMARVVHYGRQGNNTPSLYEALDHTAVKEMNAQLRGRATAQTAASSYLEIFHPTQTDFVELHTRGVRPWLAFFSLWAALLGWDYSMDVEAFHIAQKLGKKICYLETIEDQLAALDGIPFERIVAYLNHVDRWKGYKERFAKSFLRGDLEKFAFMTGEFPTRCESIITKRDPVFFNRMKEFCKEGRTTAFVGVAHIPGILKMFLNEGYGVTQVET